VAVPALLDHPELKLRIGVHSGRINRVRDVDNRPDVAGAGSNMAQRVMHCGDAGHILLSKRVADDLEQYPIGYYISIQQLKIDPVWDPIRTDPGFQQLLAGNEQIGPNK